MTKLKPGDPGYGAPEVPPPAPPKKLPNKPSWKDWQNPDRWKNDPTPVPKKGREFA